MRVDYRTVCPAASAAMVGLESAVHLSGLEVGLPELVKLRASQINGCDYCVARCNLTDCTLASVGDGLRGQQENPQSQERH